MWSEIKRSPRTGLWCDGLVDDSSSKSSKSGRKRKRAASNEESDDEANQSMKTQKKKVDNEIKVQEIVDSLKSKHGTKYTVMQLRI